MSERPDPTYSCNDVAQSPHQLGNESPTDTGPLLSFAAITDEPAPEVAAAGHDRTIIQIKPENVDRWLTPEGRSWDELQAILDDRPEAYYEHQIAKAA